MLIAKLSLAPAPDLLAGWASFNYELSSHSPAYTPIPPTGKVYLVAEANLLSSVEYSNQHVVVAWASSQ